MRFYSTFGHLYLNTSVSYHLQFARVTRPDVLRHFWRQFWQHVLKRFWRVPFCGVPCLGFARSCWLVSAARCGVAEPTPSRKQSIRDRAAGAVANVLINPCNARISTCRWAHGKGHYDNRFVRKLQFGHCVANVARDPFRKKRQMQHVLRLFVFPLLWVFGVFLVWFRGVRLALGQIGRWSRSAKRCKTWCKTCRKSCCNECCQERSDRAVIQDISP